MTGNRINAHTLRVFIDDYNDFSPKFNQTVFNVSVSESSRIGDTFRIANARAYDADVIYNKVKNFKFFNITKNNL